MGFLMMDNSSAASQPPESDEKQLPLSELRTQLKSMEDAVDELRTLLTRIEVRQQLRAEANPPNVSPAVPHNRLIRLIDWPNYHPWPSIAGLRHYVHNAHHNGFKKVYHKVGATLIINEAAFFEWVRERDGLPTTPEPTQRSRARRAIRRSKP